MDIGIYLVKNLKNNKVYIGQSINIKKRVSQHFYRGSLLYKSICKYGKENFIWGVIEYCTVEELDDKETYWIEYYKSYNISIGYNILKTAIENPVPRGSKRSEDFRNKMKEIASKFNNGGENNPFYGKKHTEESINRMKEIGKTRIGELNNFYGKKHTDKTKLILALNRKGKEVPYGLVPVVKFSKDRKTFIKYYNSLRDACKDMNISSKESTRITACCKGRYQSAFGYYWVYYKDKSSDWWFDTYGFRPEDF